MRQFYILLRMKHCINRSFYAFIYFMAWSSLARWMKSLSTTSISKIQKPVIKIIARLPATLVLTENRGFLQRSGSAKGPKKATEIKKVQRLSMIFIFCFIGSFE